MEEKLSSVAKTFTPSPIQELSHLAQGCNAINLAEGFPDFPAPPCIKQAAISAINNDLNQYRHVQGICDLLALKMKEIHGLNIDPLTDIAICCGQSEAFAATVYVPLDPPRWTLDSEKFSRYSPHNPTGKVFSREELEVIAECCRRWDCVAITDEVYEYITFDNQKHETIASLPGMQERTIITSSLSKTFSITGPKTKLTIVILTAENAKCITVTKLIYCLVFMLVHLVVILGFRVPRYVFSGWRIGWAIAPASAASAIRNIHVKITDSAPAPFQEAALTALSSPPNYFETLRIEYQLKRDFCMKLLDSVGFRIQFKPQGSFFLFAELPKDCLLSDVEYVKELIEQAGVVVVPGRGFFRGPDRPSDGSCRYQKRYIRVAFCKSDATLSAAAQKFGELSYTAREG
ncbi:probable N-succinyldiaminopimelate aminotransferase DapC [Hibiscus syriacus]|uniref:probable N-succinyldiaminopimelate aminotransferase DapC n=1 Tax=Hibiscus syriacus TaxID=106335 RepID=UPI0019216BEF|nr:probable N-succinyldiaminopimelate aminotransferase DapC [Hibiscus syriacus]